CTFELRAKALNAELRRCRKHMNLGCARNLFKQTPPSNDSERPRLLVDGVRRLHRGRDQTLNGPLADCLVAIFSNRATIENRFLQLHLSLPSQLTDWKPRCATSPLQTRRLVPSFPPGLRSSSPRSEEARWRPTLRFRGRREPPLWDR